MPHAAPPEPTEAALHEAALRHLARYASTAAGLLRVLERRIARWARTQAEADTASARQAARRVVARLVAAGAIDDAAFAAARARRLARAGRSQRAIAAHLAARGTAAPKAPPDADLAAAAIALRRRRHGPFRSAPGDERRELAALARAGFSESVARRALALSREEAEALIAALRA